MFLHYFGHEGLHVFVRRFLYFLKKNIKRKRKKKKEKEKKKTQKRKEKERKKKKPLSTS